MSRKDEIIQTIHTLLDELSVLEGVAPQVAHKLGKKSKVTKSSGDKYKGCMGGIMYLLDNDFFKTPKGGKAVSDELKKEGWHYSAELISMNLLGLTRKRALTRLEDTKTKGWVYAVRK